jgi:hypothetical protein
MSFWFCSLHLLLLFGIQMFLVLVTIQTIWSHLFVLNRVISHFLHPMSCIFWEHIHSRCLTFLWTFRFSWLFCHGVGTFRSIIAKMLWIYSFSIQREVLAQPRVPNLNCFSFLFSCSNGLMCVDDARTCCLVWLDLCACVQPELYLCKRISRTCIGLTSGNDVNSCCRCQDVQALPNFRDNIVLPFRVLFSSCLAILEQWTRRRRLLFLDQAMAAHLLCRTHRLLTAPEVHQRRFAGLARTDSVNHHQQWLLIHKLVWAHHSKDYQIGPPPM